MPTHSRRGEDGLFLHEEILLLALRDEKGTTALETMYPYAMAGALLAEFMLEDRIRVEEGKKKLVRLKSSRSLGDPVADECLKRIRDAKRPSSLKDWVMRFARLKNLKHRVARRLCNRGILKADEDKVLLIFTRKIYPQVNPAPERRIVERMRKAIFSESRDVDPRTVILVSLAHGAKLLRLVFDKQDLKDRKARIKKITEGEVMGKAAKEAIEAVRAAMAATVVVTTAATTASR